MQFWRRLFAAFAVIVAATAGVVDRMQVRVAGVWVPDATVVQLICACCI